MATIEFKILVRRLLHIGGNKTPGSPAPFARDSRGRPYVPASTLKGLHRATTEQVAAALGLKVCRAPIASQMCHPLNGENACAVCRIFGSPWLSGKLFYRDLPLTVAPVVATRVGAPQARQRRVQLGQCNASREVIPGPLTLTGHIDHLLHDPALLGLALAGLRAITALGAQSALGYGLCTVEATALDATKRPVDESGLSAALRQLAKGQP